MNPNQGHIRSLMLTITWSIVALLIGSIQAGAVNYQITPIVSNTTVCNFPHINNYGQIVWASPNSGGQFLLNFYNNGTITQIGDDFSPGCLDINDRGEIVWGAMSGGGFHLYSNGTISKIASGIGVGWLKINNKSQIVYVSNGTDIYLYCNGISTPIHIGGGLSNIDPDINDKGQIVWSGNDGIILQVYLYDNGNTKRITNYQSIPGDNDNQSFLNPKINNNGQIVWSGYENGVHNIYLWESDNNGGKITKVSNGGNNYYPDINDFGQIVWMDSGSSIYLWNINNPGSNPTEIGSGYRICPTINNRGQIAYYSGSGTDVYLATPQVIDVPTPTATPPIETFPQPNKLFADSGTFIKKNHASFSAPSQQVLNDNLSALDKFLLKAPINKFLTETLSSPGWKSGFEKGQIISEAVGSVLSLVSIGKAAKTNPLLSWLNLGIWSGKSQIYDKLKSDYMVRGIFDAAEFVGANGVAIIAGTADPITALLSFNGIIYGDLVAGSFELLANDPPDPNFTEVYQCPIANTAPLNFSQVTPEMNRLMGLELGALYNTYYYMTGITTSINRYASALAAGDAVSAGLQFEAFVKYLTLYDASAIQTATYVQQLRQSMTSQGFTDVSYSKQDILDLQILITLNGLPSEIIDLFKTIGVTDSQISDLTQAMINYVPPDSLSGGLYSNLSTGTELLRAASSWRPFNPAILLLLLD